MKKYYMVHRVDGGQICRELHKTIHQAVDEAKRLASTNQGIEFTVLETIYLVRTPCPSVSVIEMED